jgi:hypothetical protein
MNKPAGRKKSGSPKKTVEKNGAAMKQSAPSKSAGVKKKVKAKQVARPATQVKKTKTSAKPSAKSAKETKKLSAGKEAGKAPSKTARKASAGAKTASPASAVKNTPSKTALKTALKKAVKKPAGGIVPAAKRPPRKTAPVAAWTPGPKVAKVSQVVVRRELPEEYGENEVILMPVDPNVIFVDWEIKKEEIPAADTSLTMRVFDATTGQAAPDLPAKWCFDVPLDGRIGSDFFDIGMPGRDVAIEIGLHRNEKFSPILRSGKVHMPEAVVFDELGIAQKLFESGVPVGY